MPFLAVIDSKKNQQVWAKAVVSLSSIADQIGFCVSSERLCLSAVNSAMTSHAEVVFHRSFFRDYTVSFDDLESDELNLPSYSLIVNARHIATIFKNVDSSDLSYICMKIQWAQSTPSATRYKVLVEIETKSLLIKKYHISYQPVLPIRNTISTFYRDSWTQQSANRIPNTNPEKINYMMVEQLILKQFVDTVPFSTEDFKIDVKNEKILFSAYTKQTVKEVDYLKLPMSVTIALDLEELISSNLVGTQNDPLPRKTIDFRLRDFKNFISLISALHAEIANEDTTFLGDNSDCFELLFRRPGDPVLFELKNESYVTVQYIQMTSLVPEDTEKSIPESARLHLSTHQLVNITDSRPVTPQVATSATITDIRERTFELPATGTLNNLTAQGVRLVRKDRTLSPVRESQGHSEHDYITYGSTDKTECTLQVEPARKKRRASEATDYSDSDNDSKSSCVPSVVPDSFGPTQLHERPRSIFE